MPLAKVVARGVVRMASVLAPPEHRGRFCEEWDAEIWYEKKNTRALLRSAGAVADALALRRIASASDFRRVRSRRFTLLPIQEIRQTLRALRLRPFRTGVIIATLALAIGANTAIFSLLHAVVLEPLGYPDSGALVKVIGLHLQTGSRGNISPADFYDFESETTTMESMGAHGWVGSFTVTGGTSDDGPPERVPGSNVTVGFFRTLGVEAHRGGLFSSEDDEPNAPPTAVITHAFWMRRFGGDPAVIGKLVDVNAVAHEILGVLPPSYRHPEPNPEREPSIYVPYRFERGDSRSGRFIRAIGRLKPGMTKDDARSELQTIAARLGETYPDSNLSRSVDVLELKDAVVQEARTGLFVLLGAVGAVLLIACANIANLKLAEGSERRHELSIKKALGAGRWQLVRQLVIEAFVLCAAGAAAGLLLSHGARNLFLLGAIPRAEEVAINFPVLGFTFAVTAFCSVLFGLFPALVISSEDLRRGFVRGGPRHLLIAFEVAITCVLLVSASLLLGSLAELRSAPAGFETDDIATMQVSLPTASYDEGEQIPFYEDLYAKLAALPGIARVGAVNILPLSQNYSRDSFQIDARPAPPADAPSAEARSVSVDYFRTMGIPLMSGRLFDGGDTPESPQVVVISRAMAEVFWPGTDPVGQRMTYNRGVPGDDESIGGPGSREIIGVVGDVKHLGLGDEIVPMFYTPQTQYPSFHTMTLVIRASVPPESLTPLVRRELEAVDPNVPVFAVSSLYDVVENTVDAPRFRSYLLGLFAALALGVALLGIYAVIGISLDQRTQEIGIRTALGARSAPLAGLLLRQSLVPVGWGLVAGLAAAFGATRFMESLLFNISSSDPHVYLGVAALVLVTAGGAAAIPVARALRLDPVQALRSD